MDTKYSGGFAGLIALMIAVMIIVYLAATQYMEFAESRHKVIPAEEQIDGTYTASDKSPIEKAEDAKAGIEVRYETLPE